MTKNRWWVWRARTDHFPKEPWNACPAWDDEWIYVKHRMFPTWQEAMDYANKEARG